MICNYSNSCKRKAKFHSYCYIIGATPEHKHLCAKHLHDVKHDSGIIVEGYSVMHKLERK